MKHTSIKPSTAVLVAPYQGWMDFFWPKGLIKDVSGAEAGLRLLDWSLAGIDRSLVNNIVIICHLTQYETLRNHLGSARILPTEDTRITDAIMEVFNQITDDILFIYPWVVFHKEFCKQFMSSSEDDVILASNDFWLLNSSESYRHQVTTEKIQLDGEKVITCGRFLDKENWHAAFSGVVRIGQSAKYLMLSIWNELRSDPPEFFHDSVDLKKIRITDFIHQLIDQGLCARAFATSGNVLTLQKSEQLSRFVLGTKAQTLQRLSFVLEKSSISDLIMFTVAEWDGDKEHILTQVQKQFAGCHVVVRSSSIVEDGWDESLAGAFYSVLNVDISINGRLESAINDVINSYKKIQDYNDDQLGRNQVLIQQFISDIHLSGVLFTRDLHTGTPYYIINYDAESGRTDSVTSGDTNNLKTLVVYRGVDEGHLDNNFRKLIIACKEIEHALSCDSLDIEFAMLNDDTVHIFQVRPMAAANTWEQLNYDKFSAVLEHIKNYVKGANAHNGKTVFSNMTDWNPAEMISTSPNPLALSMYEYLITDSTWRLSRGECGYYNPTAERLMVSLGGKPYINVRSSFKSFVPRVISEDFRERLVDVWVNELIQHPEKHDKVEFEIVPTCYTFDLDNLMQTLLHSGMTEKEVKIFTGELRTLTDSHISQQFFLLDDELNKVARLAQRVDQNLSGPVDVFTIKKLLEDCITNGVLPFSNLARMAFMATAILKSMVKIGILSEEDQSELKGSIQTITSDVIKDYKRVHNKDLTIDEFLQKYGHLRPGTYDINSKRYDEDPSSYLNQIEVPQAVLKSGHVIPQEKLKKIDQLMLEHGLKSNSGQLIEFIKDSIRGREDAKFGFTKVVSLVLKMIEQLGRDFGIERADMAYIDIHSLLRWDSSVAVDEFGKWLQNQISDNKEAYIYEKALNLPDIITEFTDIHIYHQLQSKPNFVTKHRVVSDVICLDDNENQAIANKIVMIKSSDPGFDWIFTHKIAGLVTMYGGANSHMAIRCAEFNIPAAIGCGTSIYDKLVNENTIEIDCAGEIIRPCTAH